MHSGTVVLNRILSGYERSVRPNTVQVKCGLEIQQLGDVDEKTGTYAVSGWLHSYWKDDRLVFEKADLHWLDFVDMPINTIWDPQACMIECALLSVSKEGEGGAYS